MKTPLGKLWFPLLISLLLSGCALLSPTTVTLPETDLPQQFSTGESSPGDQRPWWEQLHNDELNRLLKTAIGNNLTVRKTWAKLRQARASAIKAGADLLPEITGKGSTTPFHSEGPSGVNTSSTWSFGLTSSYEIDLWGRVTADHRQQELSAFSKEEQVRTAILTLSGQVAKTWISIISIQEQKKLLREQLSINHKLLDLLKHRFSLARATLLDVYQQRQTVLSLENTLIPLEARNKTLYHQLAIYLGHPPGTLPKIRTKTIPRFQSVARIGLPADLLDQRPDLKDARLQLESATFQVVQARAARLPKLKLSLSLTLSASDLAELVESWVTALGASLSGSLFDHGYTSAEIERTRGIVDEKLSNYRLLLLQAIGEIEDALANEEQFRKSETVLSSRILLADKTLQEATYRYLNGISDFLPVLQEQLQSVTLKINQIKNRAELASSRINLLKALGGSWLSTIPRPPSSPAFSEPDK